MSVDLIRLVDPPKTNHCYRSIAYCAYDHSIYILSIETLYQLHLGSLTITEHESPPFKHYTTYPILIDTKYDEPTIFCFNEHGHVDEFDIKTKQWTRSLIVNLHLDYSYGGYKPFLVPSDLDRIHIITRDDNCHRTYDVEDEYLSYGKQAIYDGFDAYNAEPIFSQKTGEFLLFEERYSPEIIFNKPTSECQADHVWRRYHLAKPDPKWFRMHRVLLGWDQIIFYVGIAVNSLNGEILCLDLSHPDQWFTTNFKMEYKYITGEYLIDQEYNLHLIGLYPEEPYHFKVSLYDVLPDEIISINKQEYKLLIYGYVQNHQKEYKLSINIPWYLKEIILKYYPIFV